MDKMSLIVFEKTGHVLGAFTRDAAPEAAVEPAEVAGEGVWIRDAESGERLFTVEPQHLKVETVDRRDAVLLAHLRFAMVDGLPQENVVISGIVLTATQITVQTGSLAPAEIKAWVQVEGGPGGDRVVLQVTIPQNTNFGNAAVTFNPGDYRVLALVPGFRTFIDPVVTVP